MDTQEFAKQWGEHMEYLDKNPPFCEFCGKHHLDLENCLH